MAVIDADTIAPPRYQSMAPLPSAPYLPGLGRVRPRLPVARLLAADGAGKAGFSAGLFAYGVDHYNGGYPWEAHECWEILWRRQARGSRRWLLLKGLILLAAARVKAAQSRPAGAAELRRRGLANLTQGASAATRGEPLPGFDAAAFLREAAGAGASAGPAVIRLAWPPRRY